MTKYDILYEAIQEQYENGDLTLETAEYLNDVAYEQYHDVEYVDESELLSEAVEYLDNIFEEAVNSKSDEYNRLQNEQFEIERQLNNNLISKSAKDRLQKKYELNKRKLKSLKSVANTQALSLAKPGCKK